MKEKTFFDMNRRDFLRIGGSAALATGVGGVSALAASPSPQQRTASDTSLAVKFLGTGAAGKRRSDHPEDRRHSSILLDKRVIIDFTPASEDMLPEGFSPEAIFYTHSHGDHYNPSAAIKLKPGKIYVGETWIQRAIGELHAAATALGLPVPQIFPLRVGDRIPVGDITLTALPANHATGDIHEQTLMYLIEKGGVRIMYATDTGGIPAIAARLAGIDPHVKPGNPITGLIMESTMGIDLDEDFRIFAHSSVATVLRTVHMLSAYGRYTPPEGQPVYITHMARSLHKEPVGHNWPAPLKPANDGLEVIFRAP